MVFRTGLSRVDVTANRSSESFKGSSDHMADMVTSQRQGAK
jgi:hypothetical protein